VRGGLDEGLVEYEAGEGIVFDRRLIVPVRDCHRSPAFRPSSSGDAARSRTAIPLQA
jgi:hypothetical protein